MQNVLIVEDENPLRRIMTLNLARRGYNVVEADTGEAALDALRAAVAGMIPFNLILLDINLPDQSGWDVLRRLREDPQLAMAPPPAVIVMTAVRPQDKRLAEFHPDAVLLKPFPIEALLRLSDLAEAERAGMRMSVEVPMYPWIRPSLKKTRGSPGGRKGCIARAFPSKVLCTVCQLFLSRHDHLDHDVTCHEHAQPQQCVVARRHAFGYTYRWSSDWRDARQNSMHKGGMTACIGWMTTSKRDKKRQAKESASDTEPASIGNYRPVE